MSKCKVSFTTNEFKSIEKKYGKTAINRIKDFVRFIRSIQNEKRPKKMILLNNYLNQLLPEYDDVTHNKQEHWSTPKEFLSMGYGDCEDYVIIKYFSLVTLGYDQNKLFFTVVTETFTGTNHMVLSYYPSGFGEPYVLDNLSFRILQMGDRIDLKPHYVFNHNGVYKVNKKGVRQDRVVKDMSLYFDLIKRIQAGK